MVIAKQVIEIEFQRVANRLKFGIADVVVVIPRHDRGQSEITVYDAHESMHGRRGVAFKIKRSTRAKHQLIVAPGLGCQNMPQLCEGRPRPLLHATRPYAAAIRSELIAASMRAGCIGSGVGFPLGGGSGVARLNASKYTAGAGFSREKGTR